MIKWTIPIWLCCWSVFTAQAQGSFKITSGAHVKVSGDATIILQDANWESNGTFSPGESELKITGNISSGSLLAGTSYDVLNDLTLNRSAGLVTLQKDLYVNGDLHFSSGLFNLNGNNIVLNQPGGILIGENENSRVDAPSSGEVQISLPLIAPNQANPGNLGLVITSSKNLGGTNIQRGNMAFSGPCSESIYRYYDVQPSNNAALNATIRFHYFDAELNGADEAELIFFSSNDGGSTWTPVGFDNRNTTANWVEKSGVSSLALYTLAAPDWQTPIVWYLDADNDNYYTGSGVTQCTSPGPGYKTTGLLGGNDCDDSDPDEFPGQTWYVDADGDNYGGSTQTACERPANGFLLHELDGTGTDDCDDNDADEFPGQTWYVDADGDNYGGSTQMACERPANGFLLSELSGNGTDDCDDNDADEFPGQTWYIDADGDNYGIASLTACLRPANGYLLSELSGNGTDDCDDTDADEFPGQTWYVDADGDNYGGSSQMACERPANGFLLNELDGNGTDDCDDNDPDKYPGQTWYIDADGDNYGGSTQTACERPANGFLLNELNGNGTDDCDDNDANEFPGQTWYIDADGDGYGISSTTACNRPTNGFLLSELNGNGTDDCDDTDPNEFPNQTWYIDADGDGYGVSSTTACVRPANGFLLNELSGSGTDDCDDNDPNEFPGQIWHIDADGDGYGFSSMNACVRPTNGFLLSELSGSGTDDCDDTNAAINPGAAEICNTTDDNCNGLVDTDDPGYQDGEDPEAKCKNATVWLDASGNGTLTAAQVDDNSTDNCTIANRTVSPSAFTCSEIGTQPVTLTVFDGAGNHHSCQATVTVSDGIIPDAVCRNQTVELNQNGEASITAAAINDGSDDACGILSMTLDVYDFDCADLGARSVTLTVTDNNNNVNTCGATVTVLDKLAPMLFCKDISISLENDGSAAIAPADVYDAVNSSDNCNTINLLAVSPNSLNCNNVGSNTVTLTVDDGNGNPASCNATVTVNEFLTIVSTTATAETCAGLSDGTITLQATAPGGQVGYSIDGGNTFSLNGSFSNLPPDSYDVVIKVLGIPENCQYTATIVVAPATSTPQTWYKDLDNDGYSDGITQISCVQPAGYKALGDLLGTEIDCDDNKANWFPGQVWYPDYDVDFYGGLPAVVQCSRPPGHRRADNLIGLDTDCDNNNAAINPGATEICNGIDDDCDGEIDEGTSGGLTWTGNVVLNSQNDVNAWSSCYSIIDGNLTISGASIDSLNPLIGLEEVTGNVTIQSTGLEDLEGLDSLHQIGNNLNLYFNSSLTSLDGLENLESVGGSLMNYYNFSLHDCCAIYDLINGGVTGAVVIFFNAVNCNSVAEINVACGPGNLIGSPDNRSGMGTQASAARLRAAPEMVVFPNPATGSFSIVLKNAEETGTLQLFSVTQQLIWEQKINSPGQEARIVHENGLAPGMYLVVWRGALGVVTQKLVVKE